MSLVLDTSALMAILNDEPDAPVFAAVIGKADHVVISALTVFELFVVSLGRRGPAGVAAARDLLDGAAASIIPFDADQMQRATAAYGRFGKGIHPAARLNLSDCAAYALAMTMGAPLLFKGNDFTATDVVAAL